MARTYRINGRDEEAVYQLALRHVTGDGAKRDWRRARKLFGTAYAAHHGRATQVYASLVALGAGARPDWSAAIRILEHAARDSEAAADSLALIHGMQLNPDGSPKQALHVEPVSMSPRIAIAERLFTPRECAHVIQLATSYLRPSVVVDPQSGIEIPHPIRTSENAVLGPIQQDLVIHALNSRLAAVTGTQIEQGEPLAVLRYRPGQQYRLHHDCLPGETNQRNMTAIVYLSDKFGGGETLFETLGQSFKPAVGDAIIFLNVLENGRPDERSRHAGLPVTSGEKWIATRWIRQFTFDPWGLYD